jgi:hypothetical protein
MTTMLSLILALMLTMGGSPAVSVNPVNSIGPESGVSHDITGKPRLGEFLKIYPVETKPNAGNPQLVLNLSFQYKKSPLINLYQAFGMNPVNFADPFGDAVMPGIEPEVVKSAYIQFIQSGDSPDTALRKLEEYGYIDSEMGYKLAIVSSAHAEPGAQVLGTAAYVMFEFSPAGIFKDAVSLPFGEDLVSGEKLKWWQKGLIAVPFLTKAYKLYQTRKALKLLDTVGDTAKMLDIGGDVAKASEKTLSKFQKLSKIRAEYVDEIKKMTDIANKALSNNLSPEELEKVARILHKMRRTIGIKFKKMTPFLSRLKVYYRNIAPNWFPKVRIQNKWFKPSGYDSIYGPSFEWLRKRGKSFEDIIKTAIKPNKEINELLGIQ